MHGAGEFVEQHGGTTSRQRLEGVSVTTLVLGAAFSGLLMLGGVTASGLIERPTFVEQLSTQGFLLAMATALAVGAGLLELASWRISRDSARLRRGLILLVAAGLTPFAMGFGLHLHERETNVLLSPVTAALAAGAGLAGLRASLAAAERPHRARHRQTSIAMALCFIVVLLGMLAFSSDIRVPVDLAVRLPLELGIAVAWCAGALSLHRSATGSAVILGPNLLLALAGVWVLRGAAALDVAVWGTAPALLLAVVAIVLLTAALRDFVRESDLLRDRLDEAEVEAQRALLAIRLMERTRRETAHDVRNSLFAVRLAAQTLADRGEELAPASTKELGRSMAAELRDVAATLEERLQTRRRTENSVVGL